MKKPFIIRWREEGRGKRYTERFATLAEASHYIQDRWQGAEYMDGAENFHTDYSTYELAGFSLSDIGTSSWGGESPYFYREYKFNDPKPARLESPPAPVRGNPLSVTGAPGVWNLD